MRRFVGIVQALGVNSVPAVGLFAAGWPLGTALVLYWCENLLGIVLVALRIGLHRRKTGAKGHWLARSKVLGRAPGRVSFLRRFLGIALFFTAGHGIFLAVLVFQVFPQLGGESAVFEPAGLGPGLAAMALFLVLGFAADLPALGRRPFGWLRKLADRTMGRVIVVHLTILLGTAVMAWLDSPHGLLAVFILLKTIVDLGTWAPRGGSR